ncbi:hypothetical protein ACFVZL_36190, partial [Streptomyces sp. NPDC058320]
MQIVVAGQGYVGLPLAVRAVEVGHRVIGYDVNSRTRLQVKTVSYVAIGRWAVHGAGYVELDCSGRAVGDR